MRLVDRFIVTVACVAVSSALLDGCRATSPSHAGGSEPGTASPDAAAPSPPPAPAPAPAKEAALPAGAPASEWDLALAFVEALKARDRDALVRLLLDEKTFREVIYPDMRYYDPSRPHVADFNWNFIRANTLNGVQKVLAQYGNLDAELLDLIPLGKVEERKGYRLLPPMDLKVRTKAGDELILDVVGSMAETPNGLKLMGFRD